MNFENFFHFAFESYTTQQMSIYNNYSQYITKSLYLPNIGSFTPLVCFKSKEACIPIRVKEKGGRGGGVSWIEEET
jgi:hypothetical protein